MNERLNVGTSIFLTYKCTRIHILQPVSVFFIPQHRLRDDKYLIMYTPEQNKQRIRIVAMGGLRSNERLESQGILTVLLLYYVDDDDALVNAVEVGCVVIDIPLTTLLDDIIADAEAETMKPWNCRSWCCCYCSLMPYDRFSHCAGSWDVMRFAYWAWHVLSTNT